MLDAPGSSRKPGSESTTRDEEDPERAVHCRLCAAEVARLGDRRRLGPSAVHTFVNPQGQVFELVCFSAAAGATAVGPASLEFTWFPDHAWRLALCRSCGVQLGWHFDGPAQFWGLDRKRIV